MDRGDLARQLVGYNGWANDRILTAAGRLPGADVTGAGASFGSVIGTLAHIYDAEFGWHERWMARPDPPDAEFADIDAAAAALRKTQLTLDSYVAAWSDGDWDDLCTYGNTPSRTYARGPMLVHVVTHSTFHRGEAALLLTSAGCSPGDLDFLDYIDGA